MVDFFRVSYCKYTIVSDIDPMGCSILHLYTCEIYRLEVNLFTQPLSSQSMVSNDIISSFARSCSEREILKELVAKKKYFTKNPDPSRSNRIEDSNPILRIGM